MEVVRVFNNELSALYEVKPPISKAKMTQITKSAIKGIKFYKHIVQSVEKFIQKCRPEYKVPGLYVVDSIVRQSRHQFGADKDVFGPRFVKNINLTFQHLFKCNPDERSKIIRVLNLWQKNAVFPIDVIQPLLDMGHPNSSSDWLNEHQSEVKESPQKLNDDVSSSIHKSSDSQNWKGWPPANDDSETRTYAEMSTKNLEKFMKANMSNMMEEEASRFRNQIRHEKSEENTVKFNKKLLDFDYGDEDEEDIPKNDDNLQSTPNALALSISQNLLSNPDLLRQLQQLSSIQQQQGDNISDTDVEQHISSSKSEVNDNVFSSEALPVSPVQPPPPTSEAPLYMPPSDCDTDSRILPPQDLDERSLAAIIVPQRPLPPIGGYHPEGDKDDRIIPEPSRDLDERSLSSILAPIECRTLPPLPFKEASNFIPYQPPPLPLTDPTFPQADEDERMMFSMPGEPPLPPQDFDERVPVEESKKERSRSRGRSGRHRSRSKSPKRKRSRSRSRSRKNSRSEGRERIHEKERERERNHDRRKRGLPPVKKDCVSVCSTTLWLGHVPKSCTEGDINGVFGEFGTILSIDMIPPRGCAFVVMDRRQDANKALLKLKNLKLQSSLIKMAWAPGKGVKGKEYKEYWDVNAGVSYVPVEKIPESAEALDLLEEGGFIDEESLPENLKELRVKSTGNDKNKMDTETFGSLPSAPPPIIPPTTVNLQGMVLPHMMQPQFGMPLPGMLPPQAMVMQMPMGIPPPNPMMMVQQQSQAMLNTIGLPPMMPRTVPGNMQNFKSSGSPTGDATPTEEDGTSSPILNTQQTNPVAQFTPMMGRPLLPPPVSSAGAPIPYPPPNVGFTFPPPGMRPPTPQFPWMPQKSTPFTNTDSKVFPDQSNQSAPKQDSAEKEGSSHDMVISTDDESSQERDYPRFPEPPEFPRMRPPMPPNFHRAPPFPPRMHLNHMPGRRDPMEQRDWYPRDYDSPLSVDRDSWADNKRHHERWENVNERRENVNERRENVNERRENVNERRENVNDRRENVSERRTHRDDIRPTNVQPDKQSESKEDCKPKKDKKPNKSLMDDMFKLRCYQRNKHPSLATQLSKKLETKKKVPEVPIVKSENNNQVQKTETSQETAKESRKRSRWGRTLSEEREIQDQKRFEIEIKFQSYEQQSSKASLESSKAPSEPSEAPLESSEAPSESSEAPLESSKPPLESSVAPLESSVAPLESSKAPLEDIPQSNNVTNEANSSTQINDSSSVAEEKTNNLLTESLPPVNNVIDITESQQTSSLPSQ